MHHFNLMKWFKTLQIHWNDKWILQSTGQKSIVYWKVKLWLFGQIQVPKIIIHQNMSKYETYSTRNQNVKISFWKVKISKLRNFSKCWKFLIFFITLSKLFTMMQDDSRETSNMKVIDLYEIYNFDSHNLFQKCLDLKL